MSDTRNVITESCLYDIWEIFNEANKDRVPLLSFDDQKSIEARIQQAIDLANEVRNSTKPALHKYSVMPSLHLFKERRDKLNLTLRQVAKQTKVSAATISRIERGEGECSYHNVVQLDDYYYRNGA